ncbi:hypothetical protein C5167_010211 [Papaver somniferum]|uniref:B box-type domain-containing protein n=1 Tax=Papaver somniferum TaxID=3469 RepID=A0A4Y7JZK9_PAPSO|nr:B-box zinc finger protein 21-like [Papaver somniferum]RZC66524.1 hypothetical protein C5167_010211 [Papaver somniferum]
MKIQCDVCNKDEAAVFCSADEAALCNGCDHRVHHANKLASKHHRFSLLHPSSSSSEIPRCDICQERRAFLFCREDRAILCRECDNSIHTANELTKKHNRFLLTGVKLSSTSQVFPSGSTSTTITSTSATNIDRDLAASADSNNIKNMIIASKNKTTPSVHTSTNSFATVLPSTVLPSKYCDHSGPTSGGSTSSISEYLMETLPGWQVEDFLVDSSPTTTHGNGFCKNEEDLHPYLDANYFDNQSNSQGYVVSEDLSLWVPETPVNPTYPFDGRKNGLNLKEFVKETPIMSSKQVNRGRSDHGFTVPSISPPSNKRSRHNW